MSISSPTARPHVRDQYHERIVVLLGGGLDGYAVLLHLASLNIQNVVCMHVDYGQVSAEIEREFARSQAAFCGYYFYPSTDFEMVKGLNPFGSLLFGDQDKSPVTFGRNLVLLLHAAQFGQTIYLGLDKPYTGGVPYFDCTLEYFDQAVKLIGNPELKVAAPFIEMDKLDVCLAAIKLDPEFFEHTFTCWVPKTTTYGDTLVLEECGQCKHCRIKAELKQKVFEATQVQPHPEDEDPDHFKQYEETKDVYVKPVKVLPHIELKTMFGTKEEVESELEELIKDLQNRPNTPVITNPVDQERPTYELKETDLSMEEIERIMQQPIEDEEEGQ